MSRKVCTYSACLFKFTIHLYDVNFPFSWLLKSSLDDVVVSVPEDIPDMHIDVSFYFFRLLSSKKKQRKSTKKWEKFVSLSKLVFFPSNNVLYCRCCFCWCWCWCAHSLLKIYFTVFFIHSTKHFFYEKEKRNLYAHIFKMLFMSP